MKQYTSKDQTAKLIELGFPKPKGWGNKGISNGMLIVLYNDGREDFNYSIGELIEFLPVNGTRIKNIEFDGLEWFIDWDSDTSIYQTTSSELIDALFNMCVTLKEEGVI